jgi:hypothetical protein
MARNRVIYQSEAVYVTQSGYASTDLTGIAGAPGNPGYAGQTNSIEDLHRVQSANYSFNISRQDVNQFGELAAIDRIITETPTVSFDTNYIMANLANEKALGFEVSPSGIVGGGIATKWVSCISGLIDATSNAYQKDYFILTTKEGSDAVSNYNSGKYESIIGIGNGFITSYSSEASVGGLPTASVSVEGMNMNFVSVPYVGVGQNSVAINKEKNAGYGFFFSGDNVAGISGENPAIDPTNGNQISTPITLPLADASVSGDGGQVSALRPGDVTFTLRKKTSDALTDATVASNTTNAALQGASIADAHIQSYTLSFDTSRTPIQKLGTRFAFARPVDFPITSTLSIDAVLADLTTGSISEIINCDDEYDAIIKIADPICDVAGTKPIALAYVVRGLKIDSESFTSSIGDNKSVTLDFSAQLGGPEQKGIGVFMSGVSGPS